MSGGGGVCVKAQGGYIGGWRHKVHRNDIKVRKCVQNTSVTFISRILSTWVFPGNLCGFVFPPHLKVLENCFKSG